MVGMMKDPKVGGGVGGTCKVIKDQTQHSPRLRGFTVYELMSKKACESFRSLRRDPRVGGGVGGTSAVTKNPTQHSPRDERFLLANPKGCSDFGSSNVARKMNFKVKCCVIV
ncbi:hypothetical protein Lal_00031836 [Lupinus albus]|nr:hypothetical protein Lal_00031836 [Lupinus albus]